MKDKDFLPISKLIQEKQRHFLLPGMIQKLAATETFQEVLIHLGEELPLFQYAKTLEEADDILRLFTEKDYQFIYEHIPYREIPDILAVRYEFDNLRTALFSYVSFTNQPPVYVDIGAVDRSEYAEFFQHQDPFETSLPDYLLKPAQEALHMIGEGGTPQEASEDFQKRMYTYMLNLAEELDNDYILHLVRAMIDFHNILSLIDIRGSQKSLDALEPILIEGGSTSTTFFLTGYTKPLAAVIPAIYHKEFSRPIEITVAHYEKKQEQLVFHHLLRHIQESLVAKASHVEYGAEIPFAYLLQIEYEISQVRTILYGKQEGRSTEEIKLFLGNYT